MKEGGSSERRVIYKIYQVLGILPILINHRSDTVVQWISAGLVWSRTWVQSYKKLDFFSVIGNRISNTSYHFQYLYYPGGNETGAKPILITCIREIFLSAERISYLWIYCPSSSMYCTMVVDHLSHEISNIITVRQLSSFITVFSHSFSKPNISFLFAGSHLAFTALPLTTQLSLLKTFSKGMVLLRIRWFQILKLL